MQLNQLQIFISVAEYLNFTEAANRLFVTQSSVSQQIAQLEKEIGVALFIRNKRTVQLTSVGTVFLKEAKEIVQKAEKAIEKAQKAQQGYIGKLRIGFLAAPMRDLLPNFIRSFTQKYPEIEIELFHFDLGTLNEKIVKNELDVIFSVLIAIEHHIGIDSKVISSVPNCVFMSKEHPLAKKSNITIKDLENESFILREHNEAPQWFDHTIMLCSKNGFIPKKITQTRRIESTLIFVEAGLGIAIFPEYIQSYATPNLVIRKIEKEDDIKVVVCHNKINRNPALQLFYDELECLALI